MGVLGAEGSTMSRIFLVDDDVDLAELVRTKLASDGHDVHCIHTGEGAFEFAKKVKPDLAIVDIMLPGVTGYEICRRFRKDPELYRIGVLILTALGEEPEILHGIEQGADDYLAKPFKLDKLTEKLASMDALSQAIRRRNTLTNLPGTDAIKREINHKLARNTAIATCYIDIVGFKAYCASYGRDGQQAVLKHVAKLLTNVTRNVGIYECFISHLGGEHFAVLLNLDDYSRFCSNFVQSFERILPQLYSNQEISQGYLVTRDKNGREAHCPLMALSIGVAHTEFKQYKSAKKMFEVLAQVRQKSQPSSGKSIIFIDRRHTER